MRRKRWMQRLGAAAILVVGVLLIGRSLLVTPEEQLAALDAARAVPDEDNAAIIYAELLRGEMAPPADSNLALLSNRLYRIVADPVSLYERRAEEKKLAELELPEELVDPNGRPRVPFHSWTAADHPVLDQWLDRHRGRIDKLREAARRPACHFPACPRPDRLNLFDVPLGAFRQNAHLLRRAANRDFGEGNSDEAVSKCRDLISMGRHLSQQPAQWHFLAGIACEFAGLHHLNEFIVTGDATDRHLDMLAAGCTHLESRWVSLSRDITRVRGIFGGLLQDQRQLRTRLSLWYWRVRHNDKGWLEDPARERYYELLCTRRGHRLLIELRRFKNRTGRWPQSLEEIASSVPPLVLIDPRNEDSYLYRPGQDGFRLYSTGPNGRDEKGRRGSAGDDWPIWPPPTGTRDSQREDADDK